MGLLDARKTPTEGELYGEMAGEYRIVRKLGTGGFGTVFEAEHPVLKRKAAVKVLHANRSVDSAAVLRFIAEAKSANQIRHRHIVDIFSFGTLKGGRHFYVMDLLDGAPLDLHWTGQRMAAVALLVGSGVTLASGLLLTGAADEREREAQRILDRRERGTIGPAELDDNGSAVEQRNRFRASAIASFALSLGSLVTGAFLWELDEPNIRDELPHHQVDRSKPSVRVDAALLPSPEGLDLRARFTF